MLWYCYEVLVWVGVLGGFVILVLGLGLVFVELVVIEFGFGFDFKDIIIDVVGVFFMFNLRK